MIFFTKNPNRFFFFLGGGGGGRGELRRGGARVSEFFTKNPNLKIERKKIGDGWWGK